MSRNNKSFLITHSGLLAASSILALTCSLANPAFADKIVGDASTDSFTNASSTDNVTGNFILGNQSSGNGTYSITGDNGSTTIGFAGGAGTTPSQTPNGALIIGNNGVGSFTQGTNAATDPDNQVSVAGDVVLGLNAGSSSSYQLNSGTLTVGGNIIVAEGSAVSNFFVQNGGAVNITGSAGKDSRYAPTTNPGLGAVTGYLFVGSANNSDDGVGVYNLNGGTLSANGIVVGYQGPSGKFNQTGGTVNVGVAGGQEGDLLIGGQAGSNGSYTMTGDPVNTTVYGNVDIGRDAAANGLAAANGSLTISIKDSLFQVLANGNANGDMTVGDAGNGSLTLQAGAVDIAGNLNVGINGTGTVTQNGGTTSAAFVDLSTAVGVGSSTYNLVDGTLSTSADLNVGGGSKGSSALYQVASSSQVNIGGALRIGNANFTAAYNLRNGSSKVLGDSFVGFNNLSGSMTQSGGSFTTNTLTVGGATGGAGMFTQTAGTTQVIGAMTIGTNGLATVTSLQAGSIVNNSKLILSNATVTAATVTNNGLLEGTGTITGNVTNNGTLHPGASPGILNITGNYSQNPGGLMDFTLAGTTPGTGYSQLNATGRLDWRDLWNSPTPRSVCRPVKLLPSSMQAKDSREACPVSCSTTRHAQNPQDALSAAEMARLSISRKS